MSMNVFGELGLWKRPDGYVAAYRLLNAFDADEPLPPEELKLFMDALRVFTAEGDTDDHLQAFGHAARLRGKQGKHGPTGAEADARIELAMRVELRERELKGQGCKRAHAQAVEDVVKVQDKGKRTVQRAVTEYGETARHQLDAMEQSLKPYQPMIRAAKELEATIARAKELHKAKKARTRANKS